MPKENINVHQGICEFCKQSQLVPEVMSQKEADEMVTMQCDCIGSRLSRTRKAAVENAKWTIDKYFNSGQNKLDEDVKEILYQLSELVYDGKIPAATITLQTGSSTIKALFNKTDQGKYTVKRNVNSNCSEVIEE